MKKFFDNLTVAGKIAVALLFAGLFMGGKYAYDKWFPKAAKESKVIAVADIPPLSLDKNVQVEPTPIPSENPAQISKIEWRAKIMGWNAQAGVAFANGGATTTEGSLMAGKNIRLRLINENDCVRQAQELYAFAADYANGVKNSTKGCHWIAWMGDGVPGLITGVNEEIKKTLGPEYVLNAYFAAGQSLGEDKMMGSPEFRKDPQKLRGQICIGVILDGDWNIGMKFAGLNQVPVNSDLTTYDPDALNWEGVNTYTEAAEKYVAAQPIRREIVKNGKRTGRDTVIVPTLVVTWTPGDVVALRRPGTVSIADTYDYSGQMANTWIACKKWVDDNFNDVVDFADAILQGGDQVKARSAALSYACKVQAQVYNDANMGPSDWERYYRGVDTTDSQGNRVRLGGSRAWGLSDNVRYYGLNGGINIYEAVWNEFSRIMIEAMPERFESFEGNKPAAFSEVWNPSVINALYAKSKTQHRDLLATTSAPEFKESDRISQVVSNSKLTIEFEINSDRILPVSYSVLDKMVGSAASAENLLLEINGYTDNTGSSDLNRDLSQRRADAVKRYFLEKDPNLFRNRIQSNGYGDSNPVASNGTEAGRKKNRRVEILLGRK